MRLRRLRGVVFGLLVPTLAVVVVLAQRGAGRETPRLQPFPMDTPPPNESQVPEEVETLEAVCIWWDALAYPDVSEAPMVRYVTGSFAEVFRDGRTFEVGTFSTRQKIRYGV